MHLLNGRPERGRTHPAAVLRPRWIVAVGALLALAALRYGLDGPAAVAPSPPAVVQASAAPVIDRRADTPAGNIPARTCVDGPLDIGPAGHLVPDEALRDVLDGFLLRRSGGMNALKSCLDRRLPASAVAEAMRIAISYEAYMKAHDALLAAQHLRLPGPGVSASDLVRLSVWRDQRARLRQAHLGEQIARAWFQDDDMRLSQTIDELQRSAAGTTVPVATPADAMPARPIPHWSNKADEERYLRYLFDMIAQAVTSFESRKRAD